MKLAIRISKSVLWGIVFLCFLSLVSRAAAQNWILTGSMSTPRHSHTETLLPNGKVLVVGGDAGTADDDVTLATAELYDPATGTWAPTGSLVTGGRSIHTATLLPNGKVLIAGGTRGTIPGTIPPAPDLTESAELYDIASGTFTQITPMSIPRIGHTATLLPNGKVLVAGGRPSQYAVTTSAELYDPADGSWTPTDSMRVATRAHTATLLLDGRVLVTGGGDQSDISNAQLYDPSQGTWDETGPMNVGRALHTATLLPNGRVLVVGGRATSFGLASAELYDPASGTFSLTGSLNSGRYGHTATLLATGTVLVTGGSHGAAIIASAELYDPATETWVATGSMNEARAVHTATLLTTGELLVAGGASFTWLASVEIFGPGVVSVTIDIKPGSFPNSINLGSGGTVPVAIQSSATFNATTVDPVTVTLASAPVKLKGKGTPMASFEDVNGDGLPDLVVHGSTEAFQLSETDTEAVLEGKTYAGTEIRGADSVRIVP